MTGQHIVAEYSLPAAVGTGHFRQNPDGVLEVYLLGHPDGAVDGLSLNVLGARQEGGARPILARAVVEEANRLDLTSMVSGQRLNAATRAQAGPRTGVVMVLEDADGKFGVEFTDEKHADEWASEQQAWIGEHYSVVTLLTKADAIARGAQ